MPPITGPVDDIPDYGLAAANTGLEFPDEEDSLANITFTPDGSPFGLQDH